MSNERIAMEIAERVCSDEMTAAQMLGNGVRGSIDSAFRAKDEVYDLALRDRPLVTMGLRFVRGRG